MKHEQPDLPLMPPPHVGRVDELHPRTKKDLRYDAAAIMRKRNCRIDEAAFVLGVSESQIRNWLLDGELEGFVKSRFLDKDEAGRTHLNVKVESIRKLEERREYIP